MKIKFGTSYEKGDHREEGPDAAFQPCGGGSDGSRSYGAVLPRWQQRHRPIHRVSHLFHVADGRCNVANVILPTIKSRYH